VPGGVTKLQQALASRGYLDLSQVEEGRIDLPTSTAVRRFQQDQGLARTGNPDHATVRRLGIDPDALVRKSSDAKERGQ
jgi:peptidoglycan hydrolase-like protein with peptidoglycan-binding domain